MNIKNLLMSALMLLCGAQAFAQDAEVVLYPADGTPADGQVIEGTNVSFKLGNDGKWKAPQFINAGTANANFKQPYTDSEGNEKNAIAYISGNNNPKDGGLNADNASTGTSYTPDNKKLPNSGTYFVITPAKAGKIRACIVLNNAKSLYVTKSDGTMLDPDAGEFTITDKNGGEVTLGINLDSKDQEIPYSVASKLEGGMVEFNVEAGESYYIFCTGSKLGFGGVEFTEGSDPGPGPSGKRGDLDGDGVVTVTDIMILVNIFLGTMQ